MEKVTQHPMAILSTFNASWITLVAT